MLRHSQATLQARVPLLLAVLFCVPACSTSYWSSNADREVYGIIESKQVALLGSQQPFNIDTPYSKSDPQEIEAIEIIAERNVKDLRRIDVEKAIELSIENRREYQSEKENLYLVGMDLTRARHDYEPRFGAGSQAAIENLDPVDGPESRVGTVRSRAGFNKLMRNGGVLAVDVAQDLFKVFLGGGGSSPTTTFLAARLHRPLLRGAGPVASENLTQRERNVAYAIRSFSRFQKRNALDIVTGYCRILQEKDRVRNEYFNYRNIIAFTERAAELAQDRLPRFQVDQARQDELRARNRYVLAINSYRTLVDNYKITLGLPVGGELFFDDSVLRELEVGGLTPVPLGEDDAIRIAIDHRLDLLNEIDRFEDAQRKIVVAANAFRPELNLLANFDIQSNSGRNYSNFDPDVYRSRIGLDLDLPLDNLAARNDFRRAEIDFERQLRQLSLALDRLHQDVRSGLRGLALARERFEIQLNALTLANQRVEAVNLLLETARAETRDLLEARNDQLSARNALTSALIDYHLTRLEFLNDLGIFDPTHPRFWVENPKLPAISGNIADGDPVRQAVPTPKDSLVTPELLFQEPSPASE
jgi:outer membrane protein TolC